MTPAREAKQQRDFLIRTEKESAVLLIAEFEDLKREIFGYLTKNLSDSESGDKLSENNFLAQFLDNLSEKVDILSISAAQIVTRAQRRVIDFAAKSLSQLIARRIETSRPTPDKEAIQKLIGRTQDGTSLSKFFQRLKEPVREKAKEELIAAFSLGESNQTIAKRLARAADIGKWQALTISRTETNEAYRAATRDFYESANIQKYIWMAVLDARTCLICWNLHGQIFDSRVKVFSHPNCRCVLLPFTGQKVETGAEKFARLEAGYQKQILGPSRFELYQKGTQLNDFVEALDSDEYGKTHFIKPLDTIEMQIPNPRGARVIGKYSGRAFDNEKIGIPIEKLNIEAVRITSSGIETVEKHLQRFVKGGRLDKPEQIMVQRLRRIESGKTAVTSQDLHFYAHELREFTRYKALGFETGKGDDYEFWNNMHSATLEEYQVKEGKKGDIFNNPLYHYEAAKYLPK